MRPSNKFEGKILNLEAYEILKTRREEDKQVDKISYHIKQKGIQIKSYCKDEYGKPFLYQSFQIDFKQTFEVQNAGNGVSQDNPLLQRREDTTMLEIIQECMQVHLENKVQISQLEIFLVPKVELDEIRIISNLIGRCLDLEFLSIDYKFNSLKCPELQEFLKNLKWLTKLKILFLNFGYNQISDDGLIALCQNVKELHQLQNLSLSINDNHITQTGLSHLGHSLKTLNNLQTLSLKIYKNLFNGKGLQDLFMGLSECKSLTAFSLKLFLCKMEQNTVQQFVRFLQNVITLKTLSLDLSFSNIESSSFISIGKGIKQANQLENLEMNISGTNISNQAFKSFSDDLTAMSDTLKSFGLYYYQNQDTIEGNSYQHFIHKIPQLKQLSKLDLDFSEDNLGVEHIKNLYGLIQLPVHHFQLAIKNNQIGDQGLQVIHNNVERNYHTFYLSLKLIKQNLTNEGFREFATFLKKFHKIRKLSLVLDQNNLDQGEEYKRLIKVTKKLKYLVSFDIKI